MTQKRSDEAGCRPRAASLFSTILRRGPARRRSILSLFDQVAASANNFLTGMIIARACTREEFGIYMLCFNFVMFIMDIQTSLISSPYMVYSQRLEAKRRAVYTGSTIILQLLFCAAVAMLMVFAMLIFPGKFKEMGIMDAFNILAFAAMFMLFREFVRRLCFANLQMTEAIRVDIAVAVLQLSGLTWLWITNRASAETAFMVIAAACATASALYLFKNRHSFVFRLSDLGASISKNLSFGGWMFGSTLLWAASMSLYPWLLTWFHGTGAMGIWGACWGVAALANPIMVGIQNFLGPEIVKNFTDDGLYGLKWHVRRKTILYLAAVSPIAIGLIFFGRYLVPFFYGSKYSDSGMIVAVLGIHILVIAASYPVSRALIAIEEARTYFMASFVPLLVTLSCGIFLVHRFGPLGVALGTLLGTSVTAVAMALCFYRITAGSSRPVTSD